VIKLAQRNWKFNKKIYTTGFIISLIGSIIFLLLVALSHYYAIKGGFDWRLEELSELVLYGNAGKILFIIAAVLEGICLIFPLILVTTSFKGKIRKIIYSILAVLTAVFLILVGAVPEDQFLVAHYIVAVTFYFLAAALILATSIYIIKNHNEISLFFPIFGIMTFVIFIFHIITRWFFGRAYTQRIAILLSLIYLLILSGRFLLKTSPNLYENNLQ
jgi:hypothetical protein